MSHQLTTCVKLPDLQLVVLQGRLRAHPSPWQDQETDTCTTHSELLTSVLPLVPLFVVADPQLNHASHRFLFFSVLVSISLFCSSCFF